MSMKNSNDTSWNRTNDLPICSTTRVLFCLFLAQQPPLGHGLLIHMVSRSHTMTHHSRYDSSGRVISSSQRSLPDNTQHSQQTNIHAHGGIRTHDLSRRAAADQRLRPCGKWDRRIIMYYCETISTPWFRSENSLRYQIATVSVT